MVTALVILALVCILEGAIILIVFLRWVQRDDLWKPYIQRSYEFTSKGKIEVGLRRRGDKLVINCIDANTDDLGGDLAKAESDLRERAILLNSSTRELAR